MLVGLFKTIQRVLISAAVNLFYLSRLDTALTIKGWEWLDKGMSQTIHCVDVLFVPTSYVVESVINIIN